MKRPLLLILFLALILRLVFGLAQDPLLPYESRGGDMWWYLTSGNTLVTGRIGAVLIDLSRLPTPPGYLIMLGVAQAIFPPAEAVIAVRIVQAFMGVVICWCAYRLTLRLTNRESAALLAAGFMAISPAFIIESAQIVSETLYMFFLALGLVSYVEWIKQQSPSAEQIHRDAETAEGLNPRLEKGASPLKGLRSQDQSPFSGLRGSDSRGASAPGGARSAFPLQLVACSIFFGLAVLTRAQILLFPVGLVIHLLIVYGLRAGWRKALVLIAVYAAVVSTWTIYTQVRWGRFVIAADGFAAFLYLGATGWDGPQAVDERLGSTEGGATNDVFIDAAGSSIAANPLGYIQRRLSEWSGAVLQPHGTTFFSGESLRDLAVGWLTTDRSLNGLIAITQGDAFLQKVVLYMFHFAALIGGLVGMWRSRKNWRISLVLIGFIAYTLLVHLFLLALPRYIFPTFIAWIVFMAAAVFPPLQEGEIT